MGSVSNIIGVSYTYTTNSIDPDGDRIKYTYDWGDGTSSTTGFVNSGASAPLAHSWNTEGIYDIRAKATDTYEAVSGWSGAYNVLDAEPLAIDAHGQTARLLAEQEGYPAAIQHLRPAARRVAAGQGGGGAPGCGRRDPG